jgi:hypothetical protein
MRFSEPCSAFSSRCDCRQLSLLIASTAAALLPLTTYPVGLVLRDRRTRFSEEYSKGASQDIALRVRYATGARRPCEAPKERAMQDHGFELRRIFLLGTSVNKLRCRSQCRAFNAVSSPYALVFGLLRPNVAICGGSQGGKFHSAVVGRSTHRWFHFDRGGVVEVSPPLSVWNKQE